MIAGAGSACAACLELQATLEAGSAKAESRSATCPAGLCDTVVAVRVAEETVGFLHTGQVFCTAPTEAGFARAVQSFRKWKIDLDTEDFRRAFFATQVVPTVRHEAVIRLLTIFAGQLGKEAAGILLAVRTMEPAFVQAAKSWVALRFADDCSLVSMGRVVHMNAFTFCRQFREQTGVHFADYLGRTRVQEAQKRLQSPDARVNEVALAVGFRSLPHFNRMFKRKTGLSPTAYRRSLPVLPRAIRLPRGS